MNSYISPAHRQAYACFKALRAMKVSIPVARAIANAYIADKAQRFPLRPSAMGTYDRITCGLN